MNMDKKQAFYTYILYCGDGSLYTGYTPDLDRRLQAHNAGQGAKYTRSRLPVRLAYAEVFPNRGEAMSREAAIKRLSRKEKLALIASQKQPQLQPDAVNTLSD